MVLLLVLGCLSAGWLGLPLLGAKGAVQRQKCHSKAKGTQKIPDNIASKHQTFPAHFLNRKAKKELVHYHASYSPVLWYTRLGDVK